MADLRRAVEIETNQHNLTNWFDLNWWFDKFLHCEIGSTLIWNIQYCYWNIQLKIHRNWNSQNHRVTDFVLINDLNANTKIFLVFYWRQHDSSHWFVYFFCLLSRYTNIRDLRFDNFTGDEENVDFRTSRHETSVNWFVFLLYGIF